jgi:hypothetical protein
MEMLLSDQELEIQFQVENFVLKTQQQIAKDFYSSNITFDSEFENQQLSYNEIIEAVSEKLAKIMSFGETQLLQLLYQIDISQSQFLELVEMPDLVEKLSELVVRREAYKVYLRSQF